MSELLVRGSAFKFIRDALHDLVPFVQLKKCEKHHGGELLLAATFLKGFFIVQIVPNCPKHHIQLCKELNLISSMSYGSLKRSLIQFE